MTIVLLSGGIDSAVNLGLLAADADRRPSLALTVNYGQRAWQKESLAARKLAEHYGVEWQTVDISWLAGIQNSALTDTAKQLPQFTVGELGDDDRTTASMKDVWVANRNAILLSVAAAFAEARGAQQVYTGFNKEEATTFADNSAEFLTAINGAFAFSTQNKVTTHSLTIEMDKQQILQTALDIGVPLLKVWSCYENGKRRCFRCESCVRTENGLGKCGEKGRDLLEQLRTHELSD